MLRTNSKKACENIRAYIMENGNYIYEPVLEQERETWAAVFLTHTDMKDYFNFSYKYMDENGKWRTDETRYNMTLDYERKIAVYYRSPQTF